MIDQLNIGIRFSLYAILMPLFGLPLFCICVRGATSLIRGGVIAALAMTALLVSALSIIVITASMAGIALGEVDKPLLSSMVTDTPIGHAWLIRIVLLTLVAIQSINFRSTRWECATVSVAAAGSLATLTWSGHGAAGEGTFGNLQLVADVLHLWAAGAWIGALIALLALVSLRITMMSEEHIDLSRRALAGFSLIGSIMVGLIIATGLLNSVALIGLNHVLILTFSLYGQLMLIKLALFSAMLSLAAMNRFRLTPELKRAGTGDRIVLAVQALRRSLATELGAGIAILALVAWLGTLEPPISA